MNLARAARWAMRSMSTTAGEVKPYPFSKTALVHPETGSIHPPGLKAGKGLMPYLHKTLPSPEKRELLNNLFSRSSPNQLVPGSVVSVTMDQAPGQFSGILLGIRRRGPDTSFVVRNIIQRVGVEMQFFVNSPLLQDIKVLQKAKMRRAKLFYLRDSPQKMSRMAGKKN